MTETMPPRADLPFDPEGSMLTEEVQTRPTVSDELGNEALDILRRSRGPASDEVVATALEYLASKPVGYNVRPAADDEGDTGFVFALGGIGIATVNVYTNESSTADVGMLTVNEQLRRHGLATRLMHAAVSLMKDRGITNLDSGNLSRDALLTRIAVFGEENLSFYFTKAHRLAGRQGPPPATVGEALELLNSIEAARSPEDNSPMYTFGVHTDLTKVDTDHWERPVPVKIDATRVIYEE